MNIDTNGNSNLATSNGPALTGDEATTKAIAAQVLASIRGGDASASDKGTPIAATGAPPSWVDFARALDQLIVASPDLRDEVGAMLAKNARQTLAASGAAVPSTEEFLALVRNKDVVATKGGTRVRAFWWGFHIQVSHADLQVFLDGAGSVSEIVDTIGKIPTPAAPFIRLAALFIAGALGLLKRIDRGRGVYISMSWFAPGAFVPTSV
jgi:hypothetical protein